MADTASREPRAVILDAARGVLDTSGYRGFTVEAVATRAGVDRAVIDRWWTGADDLLIDVFAEAMTIKKIPNLGNSRGELSIAVRHMISHYTDWERIEPALLAFAADHATDPAVLERLRQRCVQRGRARIGTAIRRAAARGDLPPDVDSDLVQDVWAGTIAYRRLVSGGPLGMDQVDPLLDLVLSGMAPVRAPDAPTERPTYEPPPWWLEESATWLHHQVLGRVHRLTDGVPVRALGAVRPTTTIAGHAVTVDTHVSRDFTPSADPDPPPNSTGVGVIVTITAAGPRGLPPFLRAERIAVLHDDEVWVAPLVEWAPRNRTSRSFQMMAWQGPEWEVGSKVDAVVELRAEEPGQRLVRTWGQRIEAIE